MNANPNKDNIAVSRSTVNKTIIIAKDDMWLTLEKIIRQTDTIKITS